MTACDVGCAAIGTALVGWAVAAVLLDQLGARRRPGRGYAAIVVAGAPLRADGSPGGALRRRTLLAVDLWKRGLAPKLTLTGGHGEAAGAAALARAHGVPEAAIVVEGESTSTADNARLVRPLLGDVAVLVVTDSYHAPRTERVFRRHFSRADAVGATPPPLARARMALREVVVFAWYAVSGRA